MNKVERNLAACQWCAFSTKTSPPLVVCSDECSSLCGVSVHTHNIFVHDDICKVSCTPRLYIYIYRLPHSWKRSFSPPHSAAKIGKPHVSSAPTEMNYARFSHSDASTIACQIPHHQSFCIHRAWTQPWAFKTPHQQFQFASSQQEPCIRTCFKCCLGPIDFTHKKKQWYLSHTWWPHGCSCTLCLQLCLRPLPIELSWSSWRHRGQALYVALWDLLASFLLWIRGSGGQQ